MVSPSELCCETTAKAMDVEGCTLQNVTLDFDFTTFVFQIDAFETIGKEVWLDFEEFLTSSLDICNFNDFCVEIEMNNDVYNSVQERLLCEHWRHKWKM